MNYLFPAADYTPRGTLLWGTCIQHLHCASQEGALGKRIVHLLVGIVEMIPIVGQIVALFERYLALHHSVFGSISEAPPALLATGTTPLIDLITGDELETSNLLIVNGTHFSANSLAKYCTTAVNDRIVTTAANQEIILWESGDEYLDLLKGVRQLIEDPKLIAAIQLRIDGYHQAQAFIREFDNAHDNYSFRALLNDIQKFMAQRVPLGATILASGQQEGFDAYYTLYTLLPEPIVKVIFPAYAVDKGDIHCIGSMSKVFSIQIERLEHLQLIMPPSSPSSTLESHTSLSTYINWVEKKYPIQQMPSLQETHWGGDIQKEEVTQVLPESYRPTLRYVKGSTDAHHALAMAIIEKYERFPSLFEGGQDSFSRILQSTDSQLNKKTAIQKHFDTLESKNDLELLKNTCTLDDELFDLIRDKLFPNPSSSNYPSDQDVWMKLSTMPETIEFYINTYYKSGLPISKTRVLLIGTPMEIPFSYCSDLGGLRPVFFGEEGKCPFILKDQKTGEYHVLLSIQ